MWNRIRKGFLLSFGAVEIQEIFSGLDQLQQSLCHDRSIREKAYHGERLKQAMNASDVIWLIQLTSQETRYFCCGFARQSSQGMTLRIESPPSFAQH